jgi:hypothetical protein
LRAPRRLSAKIRYVAVLLALPLGALTASCTVIAPLAPGCRPWDSTQSGTDPPSHCMFFPGSIAVDPLGDVLYATSTNADLSFGGSTLFAVDLLRFERAVGCFRNPNQPECGKIDCAQSGYALGLLATVEQTEKLEAQSGIPPAQFDRCYCQRDVDDPEIVNCEPQRFILSNQTTKLGFFPAEMRVLAEDPPLWGAAATSPNLLLHRGLYIAVRGDPSVTFIDATRPLRPGRQPTGSSLTDLDSLRLDFNCGSEPPRKDDQPTAAHTPGQPYTLKQCADANRVQRTIDDVLVDMDDPGQGTIPRFQLPAEPLDVVVDRGCLEPGAIHERGSFYGQTQQCDGTDAQGQPVKIPCDCYTNGVNAMGQPVRLPGTYYQYLVTTHLANGQVSAFQLPGTPTSPEPPVLQDVSAPLFPGTDQRRGAFSLAPRVPGDLSQPWYATSRMTGQLSTFRLASAAGPKIVPGLFFTISNQFSSGEDVRDVLFEPGSARAFFAVYTPPSLVVLDTRSRSGSSDVPNNQVTSIVNLCPGPSRLAMARVPRTDMGEITLATRLYATCYLSGQLAEVDADSGELTGTIQIGRGPLSIALNFGSTAGIDPCADPYISDQQAKGLGVTCLPNQPDLRPRPFANPDQQIPPRAYVSTYLDSAIAVVDLDPSSPRYRRTTARIGLPSPKRVQ